MVTSEKILADFQHLLLHRKKGPLINDLWWEQKWADNLKYDSYLGADLWTGWSQHLYYLCLGYAMRHTELGEAKKIATFAQEKNFWLSDREFARFAKFCCG